MRRAETITAARRDLAATATTVRSVRLFKAFRVEQTDPEFFYSTLADDALAQLETFTGVAGSTVLDVGGGPGYFRRAFLGAGARYVAIDADRVELEAAGGAVSGSTVLGSGTALPIGDATIDVCFSSNVLEHVDDPRRMADEMVRVTRPGGLVYLSYTLWLSPWGGHETSPWHYLGGRRAARRYERTHGKPPKNRFGISLFALSAATMLRWARAAEQRGDVQVLSAFPRYLPKWAWPLLRVPGLRELATWNLVLVLRRR